MTGAHLFYIPILLLVGFFGGFFAGKRAAEQEALREQRRKQRKEAALKKKEAQPTSSAD